MRTIFAKLDADGDDQISESDLTSALKKSGFGEVPKSTVQAMVRDAARSKNGSISFSDVRALFVSLESPADGSQFLDAASSMKEVHLSNAFSNVIKSFDDEKDADKAEVGSHAPDAKSTDRRRIR